MSLHAWSLEGNHQQLDGGAMYGNAPRALWQRWSPPDAENRIDLAGRCLLVRAEDRWILHETGVGAFFAPELRERYGIRSGRHELLDALAAVGLNDRDIDVVVLSHLHFDHAGGLLSRHEEGPLRLLFPRAQFLVGAAAWARACHPHPRDRASFIPELAPLLEASGRRLVLLTQSSHPILPGWRFHTSEGHTPGLILSELPAEDGPVVFAADLIPGRPWVHLPITMGYDRFPERLIDEKDQLLSELLARGGRLFFTHDPDIALATLARDQHGRYTTTDPKPTLSGVVL